MRYIDFEYLKGRFNLDLIKEYPNKVLEENPEPLVSVILITYNHKEYIRDSIEGVLKQETIFPFEIIIGDDESSDGTREICIEYAQRYPNKIRLVLHSRKNVVNVLGKPCGIFQITYNHLIARGKYVAICSGDDFWTDKYKLQKQFEYLEQHNNVALVYSDYIKIDITGDIIARYIDGGWPKASTYLYRNFRDEIPIEFLNIIQEDWFTLVISSKNGLIKYLSGIKPTVVNVVEKSITNSFKKEEWKKHRLNAYLETYKYSKEINHPKKNVLGYLWLRLLFQLNSYRSIKEVLIHLSINEVFNLALWRISTIKKSDYKIY